MRINDTIWLSFCNLKRTRVRSFLTVFGVVIGISSIMLLVSLGIGLERITTSQIANMDTLMIITVTQKQETASMEASGKINDQTIAEIKKITKVKDITPFINAPGAALINNTSSEAIITGLDKSFLKSEIGNLIAGKEFDEKDGVVISKSLSTAVGVEPKSLVGMPVTITLMSGDSLKTSLEGEAETETAAKPQEIKTTIMGVESTEKGNFIYAPLDLVNMGKDTREYSSLKVKVTDQKSIDSVSEAIKDMGFEVTTVKELIDQINKVFLIIEIVLAFFGMIGLLVASLGIINTMAISLIERIREIGIMKAIGASDKDVSRLFLTESALIGFYGGVIGIGVALGISTLANAIFAMVMKNANQTPLPLFVNSWKFSFVMLGFSILISLFAGIYPAHRAKVLEPLKALYQR